MTEQDIQFLAGKTDIVALTGVFASGFVTPCTNIPILAASMSWRTR
jgi:hypothetical protein